MNVVITDFKLWHELNAEREAVEARLAERISKSADVVWSIIGSGT